MNPQPPFERLEDVASRLEREIMEADWNEDEVERVELLARLAAVRFHMSYGEEFDVPF